MEIVVKKFDELQLEECYAMLKLRSEIFVVEQNCVYLDIDNKDQKAWHVIGREGKDIVALTRIFKAGDYFERPSIGRVAVAQTHRGTGLGHEIMKASIGFMEEKLGKIPIEISAQAYLINFYRSHGFETVGEEYLEDDIPHIRMIRP